jgi:parallel beta-helix repeat protein
MVFEARTEITVGVITIWDDGHITPDEAPIQQTGDVFTLTDDISGFGTWGIEILRSNIILDGNGYTLRSTMGYGMGIDIDGHYYLGVHNVTIRNLNLENWGYGVFIDYSSLNTIHSNNLTENSHGVFLSESSSNMLFENTISASDQSGISILDSSHDNTATNNSLTNNNHGMWFAYSAHHNTATFNTLSNNNYGIYLADTSSNEISHNNFTNTETVGIRLWGAASNSIIANLLDNCTYGFEVNGYELSHFMHTIDVSNLVNGKPVYYLMNQSGPVLTPTTHSQVGFLAIVNCTNSRIQGLTLSSNGQGLLLAYTTSTTITDTLIARNNHGLWQHASSNTVISRNRIENNSQSNIYLSDSSANIIFTNNLTKSRYGIYFENSSANHIYHNNFIDNINHTYDIALDDDFLRNEQLDFTPRAGPPSGSLNTWDNGYPSGGNYWDNYNGTDLHMGTSQNETGSDGIGDQFLAVYENNTDKYPLMGMFHCFNTSAAKHVNVISNSTINTFQYVDSTHTISLLVSNSSVDQTSGFIRICVPHALVNETYRVTVNGSEPYYTNYNLDDNGTHRWMYFEFEHSTVEISIVPDFLWIIILPLFIAATLLTTMIVREFSANKNHLGLPHLYIK